MSDTKKRRIELIRFLLSPRGREYSNESIATVFTDTHEDMTENVIARDRKTHKAPWFPIIDGEIVLQHPVSRTLREGFAADLKRMGYDVAENQIMQKAGWIS